MESLAPRTVVAEIRRQIQSGNTTTRRLWAFLAAAFAGVSVYYLYLAVRGKVCDFELFYTADKSYFHGGSLYHRVVAVPSGCLGVDNNNSPAAALLFAPLSRLPLHLAALVWVGVSVGLLAWSMGLIWSIYRPGTWLQRGSFALAVYASLPVLDAVLNGTWGMITGFLDCAAWYAARQGRDYRAGICLALALMFRWQSGVLLLLFIVLKRRRVLLAAVATAVVANALALAVFGLRSFQDFLHNVTSALNLATGWTDGTFHALFSRFADELSSHGVNVEGVVSPLSLFCSAVLLAATLWLALKTSYDLGFALSLLCGMLIVPTSWVHYYMALLLPLTLLMVTRRTWIVGCTLGVWLVLPVADRIAGHLGMLSLIYGTALNVTLVAMFVALARVGIDGDQTLEATGVRAAPGPGRPARVTRAQP